MSNLLAPLLAVSAAAGAYYVLRSIAPPRATSPAAPGSPQGSSAPSSRIALPSVSPEKATRHRAAHNAMRVALSKVLGHEPSKALLYYAQAVAYHETRYGRGWPNEALNACNNWGAVQCALSAVDGRTCVLHKDSRADGTVYQVGFRCYATPEEGAEGTAKQVAVNRPTVVQAVEETRAVADGSRAMRGAKYYEGFCPKATAQYGAEPARASFKTPARDAGTTACSLEAIEGHTGAIWKVVLEIAASVGDNPPPLTRGDVQRAWDAWRAKEGQS